MSKVLRTKSEGTKMNYKNIIIQNEFSFEYSFDEMNTSFVTE